VNHFNITLTIQGTVKSVDPRNARCEVTLRSGDTMAVQFSAGSWFTVMTNADGVDNDKVEESAEPQPTDLARRVAKYIRPKDVIFVRGILQENGTEKRFDGRTVWLQHYVPGKFLFEETHWWLTQVARFADAWLDDIFGDARTYREDDFSALYATNLNILGGHTDDKLQATATLSRLIYGLSSTFLLTGDHRYRVAAAAGVEFQRSAFRSLSHDNRHCFWAYGRRKKADQVVLIMGSENSDDLGAIALYEQIYALAGLTQYYRISNDPDVLHDIARTIRMFNDFFLDSKSVNPEFPGLDGYFSHIDPVTMRPDSASLGPRQSRKNWNSVGDHVPAYLINLILALDPLPQGSHPSVEQLRRTCHEMLDRCVKLIIEKLPDPECDYVNERFFANWKPDQSWGWQQNRAIIGHNYKIAWNLTRVANLYLSMGRQSDADNCLKVATKLGKLMISGGADQIRGGCFDAVERKPTSGQPMDFVWGNTKDFWQQEQAILANLILYGYTHDAEYLDQARAMSAFWNMFFIDHDNQGVFFRVSDNGQPIIEGAYAAKAGYPIAGYHSFELNYLAHIYTRTFVGPVAGTDDSFCLYFKPCANSGFRSINVAPDGVRPGTTEIESVTVQGRPHEDFIADTFQVHLAESQLGSDIVVVYKTKRSA
jgi:mannose/cellobiose epimerase-like protein (N-acyl-D-glucosamine 2-epimerase family)